MEFWEGGPNDGFFCENNYPCVPWISWDYFTDERTLQGLEFMFSAFGERYANEPTIFAWDLQNEPSIRWSSAIMTPMWKDWVQKKYQNEDALKGAWSDYPLTGENWNNIMPPDSKNNLSNQRLYDYQTFREDIAYIWVKRLADAIRSKDINHFVTVGNIQWIAPISPFGRLLGPESAGVYPAFNPKKLAPVLDYSSIHAYGWWDSNTPKYAKAALRYSYAGKPVVLEEFKYSGATVDGP